MKVVRLIVFTALGILLFGFTVVALLAAAVVFVAVETFLGVAKLFGHKR